MMEMTDIRPDLLRRVFQQIRPVDLHRTVAIQTIVASKRRDTCGMREGRTNMSPRLMSISSSRQTVTDCGA